MISISFITETSRRILLAVHNSLKRHSSERRGDIIEELKGQLQCINELLEGRRCYSGSQTKKLISIIRKFAFDAEDLIELYQNLKNSSGWLINCKIIIAEDVIELYQIFKNSSDVIDLYQSLIDRKIIIIADIYSLRSASSQIKEIVSSLDSTYGYHVGAAATKDHCPFRECTPCGKPYLSSRLIEETQKLVAVLTGENHKKLCTISIVGMGGIGKTTLAGKVYTDPTISSHFNCHWWISVTRHFGYKDFLIAILVQRKAATGEQCLSVPLGEPLEDLEEYELEDMVSKVLKHKKYLVVLDDIWTQEAWNKVKSVFPDNNKGSRLVITTRNTMLQTGCPGISHPMESLGYEESREMFYEQAFITKDKVLYPEILQNILKSCAGLPLAIKVVGTKLRSKILKEEWEAVSNQLCNLEGDSVQNIIDVLSLSYDNLSSFRLMSCFLRVGFFPENYEISCNNLIYLWAAEGLLQCSESDGGATSIEILGESHVDTLAKNGLIEAAVMSSDETTTSIKKCKIHPLLRAFAVSKAKEELFFQSKTSSEIRHGAFISRSSSTCYAKAPHLRSLLTFQPEGNLSFKQFKSICCYSKVLKVLYLEGMHIEKLPKKIGSLLNLRYLNLCNTGITYLPKSVRSLVQLLTLDVSKNERIKGINIVKRLKKLRNLLLEDSFEPFRIGSLHDLRSLGWVRFQHLDVHDMQNMASLEVLKIVVSDSNQSNNFLAAVARLGALICLKLKIEYSNPSNLPISAEMLSGLKKLKKLHLKVVLESESNSEQAMKFHVPMENLIKLPNLKFSTLQSLGAEKIEKLDSESAFQLVYIKISYLNN